MVSKLDTAWDLFLEGKTSEAKFNGDNQDALRKKLEALGFLVEFDQDIALSLSLWIRYQRQLIQILYISSSRTMKKHRSAEDHAYLVLE